MRRIGSTMLAGAAIALGACNTFRSRPVEIKQTETPIGSRWNATLSTPSDLAGALQLRGSAWMAADPKSGNTRVQISVSNAAPGGVHPWHVHRGQCGNDEGIFGSPDAYRNLRIDGDGKASSTATLALPVPTSGDFHVNVHASPDNMGTIVACGNLAPPTQ